MGPQARAWIVLGLVSACGNSGNVSPDATGDAGNTSDSTENADAFLPTIAPSWVGAIPVGAWARISGTAPSHGLSATNTVSSLDPEADPVVNPNYPNAAPWRENESQASVIEAWSGGAIGMNWGPSGTYFLWGGGHAGYHGNEIYGFDLETRVWARITDPYVNANAFPVPGGLWPDGSPNVPHTYGNNFYHPGTRSFGCSQVEVHNDASDVSRMVFFGLEETTWRASTQNPVALAYGGWTAYDAQRDAFWMESGDSPSGFHRFSMNGNDGTVDFAWTAYDAQVSSAGARGAIDPVDDIAVITKFDQAPNDEMYGVSLSAPESSRTLLTQTNRPGSTPGRHGWVWSPSSEAFLYWSGTPSVYRVKKGAGAWQTAEWAWTDLLAGSNTVTPTSPPEQGTFNRFELAIWEDAEVAIVINDVTESVFAFRVK